MKQPSKRDIWRHHIRRCTIIDSWFSHCRINRKLDVCNNGCCLSIIAAIWLAPQIWCRNPLYFLEVDKKCISQFRLEIIIRSYYRHCTIRPSLRPLIRSSMKSPWVSWLVSSASAAYQSHVRLPLERSALFPLAIRARILRHLLGIE